MRPSTLARLRSICAGAVLLLPATFVRAEDLQLGGVCVAAALLVWRVPAVARFPLALLAGVGMVTDNPWAPLRIWSALAAAALALATWRFERASAVRAVLVVFTLAVVRVATHQTDPVIEALPLLVLLVTPVETHLPRGVLMMGLLGAAVPGAIHLEQALQARAKAAQTDAVHDWLDAASSCERVGWWRCQELATLKAVEADHSPDHDRWALLVLQGLRAPAPETVLLQSDLQLAPAEDAAVARLRLSELAEESPSASRPLSPLGARTWAHALARAGHRAEAAAVAGLPAPFPAPTPLPEGFQSFADAIAVSFPPGPAACVKRGEALPLAFTWLVQDGFAPGERFLCFVHADGPRTLGFDHAIGGREATSMRPGERIDDPLTTPVPRDAPPGRYVMHVGVYAPDSGVRLQPRGQPTHIRYLEGPSFEVCP